MPNAAATGRAAGGAATMCSGPAGVTAAQLVTVGDSIAINGCCLTIVEVNGSTLSFDVSAETLRCTLGALEVGARVNLEVDLVARYVARLHEA